MRLVTADRMVEITLDMFTTFIEPLACSFMYGEVPTSTIMIHRTGNYDNGWFTKVHFKNTISISIFRCEVYLHDILSMCRDCKMWLVTESMFKVAILFSMMYPLYQTQFMDFSKSGVIQGYDNMINEAAHETYMFIQNHYSFENELERITLDTIYYHNMRVNQLWKYFPNNTEPSVLFDELFERYRHYMLTYHYYAYKTAIKYKAQDWLVNNEGFLKLEFMSAGEIKYDEEIDNDVVKDHTKDDENNKPDS